MIRFLGYRLFLLGLLVVGLSIVTFAGLQAMPGGPVETALAERGATPEAIRQVKESLGLDRPLVVQYLDWMSNAVRGDFGTSLISGAEITPDIMRRLPRTLELAAAALAVGAVIGVPLGVAAGRRPGHLVDGAITAGSVVGLSVPVFVVGTLLVLVFSVKLKWFPIGRYVDPGTELTGHLQQLVLPSVTLGIVVASILTRMTRSVVIAELGRDYVFAARAMGLSEHHVVYRRALPNALPPVITVGGLAFGELLGGTVIVESIFAWPGMSTLLITSAGDRDYPIILAVVVVLGIAFIMVNIVIDLINISIDPRTRP